MQVTDIQRFCMHDGPGVRTTVFLKGCPLRCAWCHNPETQQPWSELLYYAGKCIGCGLCQPCPAAVHQLGEEHVLHRERCVGCGQCVAACPTGALELVGKEYTPADILVQVQKDSAFYGTAGGVTVSGGEPFAQGEQLVTLLRLCKEAGLHTAVETCGYFDPVWLPAVAPYCDLLLWDVKDTDPVRHRQYTGVENQRILSNLQAADAQGCTTRLRCILVSGVNTEEAHYRHLAMVAAGLHHCEGVEFLPYHAYGSAKAQAQGTVSNRREEWVPTPEQVASAKQYLQERGIAVF